ncbi:hypothetical protein [Thalassotalea atypica]|uniref:hypothetical protein n=1 Tax=Thalassotalea atypica TaxID=2054316 RepID=UPI002574059C|nr:hypothetical protein [Thalassotalea atypica]
MQTTQFLRVRNYFIAAVSVTIWSMLIWQHLHDGVPSHHLFQSADYPAMSNWWGAIILPVFSWFTLGSIKKRLFQNSDTVEATRFKQVALSFVIALCYGAALSLTFTLGYSEISSVLFPSILIFAMFFKVYRAEFFLGFLLSMSLTFGAVLPTMFGTIICLASFVVYTVMQFIWRHFKRLFLNKQVTS